MAKVGLGGEEELQGDVRRVRRMIDQRVRFVVGSNVGAKMRGSFS